MSRSVSKVNIKTKMAERARAKPAMPAAGPPHAAPSPGELIVEALDRCRPKPTRYLVPGRIPAGMMGLLAGEGGHGKSMTTLELVAAVTAGRCAFGLTYPGPAAGKAVLISCEDDYERTVVPRLAALGANLSAVLRVRGVRTKADGATLDFHMGHYRELERLLRENREVRLVVIDPAGAYIGRAGVNEHKDSELRAVLGPLSEAANRTGATVLLVKHLNKSAGASAVQRVGGSTGYINAVRFAYLIAPDPADAERKLMLPIKANVLPSGTAGLAYRMAPIPPADARAVLLARWPDLDTDDLAALSAQLFRQEWEKGEVKADPNEVTRGEHRKPKAKTAEETADWMRSLFQEPGVAYPSAEVIEGGRSAGYGRDACYAALSLLKERIGLRACKAGRFKGVWHWGIGNPDGWTVRESLPPLSALSSCQEVQEVQEVVSSGSSGSSRGGGELPELPELPEHTEHPDTGYVEGEI